MSDLTLTKTRLHEGIWEGVLTGGDGAPPKVQASYRDTPIEDVAVLRAGGATEAWKVKIPVPTELLSDGVHTVLISEAESGERLGSFTILAGDAMDEDLRAEVDLLRAELDMLKRAFRRHCVDTMGG